MLRQVGSVSLEVTRVEMTTSPGPPELLPVLVARGRHPGPVLTITLGAGQPRRSALTLLESLFESFDLDQLHGTLVGTPHAPEQGEAASPTPAGPMSSLASLEHSTRSERFVDRIVRHCDYFVEVSVDSSQWSFAPHLRFDVARDSMLHLARLLPCPWMVRDEPAASSLRGVATRLGLPHLGWLGADPASLQWGFRNALCHLRMLPMLEAKPTTPVVQLGALHEGLARASGRLHCQVTVGERVRKGQNVAQIVTPEGRTVVHEAQADAIVLGLPRGFSICTGEPAYHLGLL